MNSIVFFDVDGVLLRGQSLNLLTSYLLKKGKVPLLFWVRISFWFLLYKFHLVKDVFKVRTKALMIMEGWDVKEITALFLDFHVQVIRPLICKEVVEMIKKHAKDGDEVVLASASLDLIIKNIADDLDGLRFIATLLEVKNGKYTGKVDGLISYGENKLILVKKMMTDRGLSWTGSWAYTDDASDLPLLKAVDHPAVINPHQRLRDIAKQEAWPIYDL